MTNNDNTSYDTINYYKNEQKDSQNLINTMISFISYTFFVLIMMILGIVGIIGGFGLIFFGAILFFSIHRYNQINEMEKNNQYKSFEDQINELKNINNELKENNENNNLEITQESQGELHSHGNFVHRHPRNYEHGTNNGVTSTDSDDYGICDDGETLHKKYLMRYQLLDYGTSGYNVRDNNAIKKIKLSFNSVNINSNLDNNQLTGSETNLYETLAGFIDDDPSQVNKLQGIKVINRVQILELRNNGIADIAELAQITLSSGNTSVDINNNNNNYINGKHVKPINMIDSSFNTYYFGGLHYDDNSIIEKQSIIFTLNNAVNKNDLASFVLYTPVNGSLGGCELELFNDNDEKLLEFPVTLTAGGYSTYHIKFGAIGGDNFIERTININDNIKNKYSYGPVQDISKSIFNTRKEYAESHYLTNKNENIYDCSTIQDEDENNDAVSNFELLRTNNTTSNTETFINREMFGEHIDITNKFKTIPVSHDLI